MVREKKMEEVTADPLYENETVAKFVNHVMKKGKKTVARKVVYGAFEKIEEKNDQDPLEIFERAIRNVKPKMEVRSKRVGGANYQVPYRVPEKRGETLAMRWIISAASRKKGAPMKVRLANEILQAAANEGDAVRKRINVHRMAEANKAFAHLAR